MANVKKKEKEKVLKVEVVEEAVESPKVEPNIVNPRLAELYALYELMKTEKITRLSDLENKIAEELKK